MQDLFKNIFSNFEVSVPYFLCNMVKKWYTENNKTRNCSAAAQAGAQGFGIPKRSPVLPPQGWRNTMRMLPRGGPLPRLAVAERCVSMSEATDRFTLTVGRLSLAGYRWETARPKAAVCILHGIGEHAGRYAHVAARLNILGYSAYAVDLPGHGQSPGPRGHAGGTQALMRIVDSLVIYAKAGQAPGPVLPVFVMGHSMGGNIALSHRLYRPDTGVRGYIASAPWLETDNKLLRDQFALCRLLAFFAPGLRMDTGLDEDQLCANPASDAPDAA